MLQNLAGLTLIKSLLASFFIFIAISGCATLKSDKSSEPEEVNMLILTAPTINPDSLDRPSPIRVDFIQLSDTAKFITTNYANLIDSDNDLNGELLDRTQLIIQPDDIESLKLELNEDTKYLGVIAGYKDIDSANWKLVLERQPATLSGNKDYLNLKIEEYDIFQFSKKEMRSELKYYAEIHPESEKVTPRGKYKKPKLDYSKGIFVAQ